jgi:hypothetical protein
LGKIEEKFKKEEEEVFIPNLVIVRILTSTSSEIASFDSRYYQTLRGRYVRLLIRRIYKDESWVDEE